ncbi:hypothetical protein DPMN_061090 [Dreissena polymorpha]|uniref:Uncharacterized protein n=1 Tax=Dreissena polymorpha TaxID=45954 RepID=A0A9D4C769_DREPO|nr:hypothetical protein DPMN_061090 [Dreissena polymorpha]
MDLYLLMRFEVTGFKVKSEGTVINIDQDSISSIYDEESRDSPTATQKTQVFKQPNFVKTQPYHYTENTQVFKQPNFVKTQVFKQPNFVKTQSRDSPNASQKTQVFKQPNFVKTQPYHYTENTQVFKQPNFVGYTENTSLQAAKLCGKSRDSPTATQKTQSYRYTENTTLTPKQKTQVFKQQNFVKSQKTRGIVIASSSCRPLPSSTGAKQRFIVVVFQHSSIGTSANKKARAWKNLKQIITAERALPWGPDDTTCECSFV